ncbi:hypothetical protein H0V99_03570 [Candidatus Saccharibacteria bacterium]|nr:hypothetical protein [Candidatus Saccharibacteria bacterium]
MREKTKADSLLSWIKSNIVTILVTILLLLAAAGSLSYAYNRGRGQITVANDANEISTSQEHRPLAQEEAVPDSNESPSSSQPEQEGSSLGANVSCEAIENNARKLLEKARTSFGTPKNNGEVEAYNHLIGAAYRIYEQAITAKGCTPELELQDIEVEAGTNILPDTPAVL